MPAGRPPKYRKKYCEMLIDHMSFGLSYESFAGLIGVTRQSLYDWEKRHKEFLYSKTIGREKMLLFFEKMGIKAMAGKIPNFNASTYIFTTKNKLGWRDQQDTNVTGSGININYSVMPKKK